MDDTLLTFGTAAAGLLIGLVAGRMTKRTPAPAAIEPVVPIVKAEPVPEPQPDPVAAAWHALEAAPPEEPGELQHADHCCLGGRRCRPGEAVEVQAPDGWVAGTVLHGAVALEFPTRPSPSGVLIKTNGRRVRRGETNGR